MDYSIENLCKEFLSHSIVYDRHTKIHKEQNSESTISEFNLPHALWVMAEEICRLKKSSTS